MASKVVGIPIPFPLVFDSIVFILIGIGTLYKYENGVRTSQVVGYWYEVVDTTSYDKFKVKVEGQQEPLMPIEEFAELRENGEKVLVEFENGVVRQYYRKSGSTWTVEDSFSADDVLLAAQKNN